jgi:hypothetical protein
LFLFICWFICLFAYIFCFRGAATPTRAQAASLLRFLYHTQVVKALRY